jgi:hypothetical protein
MEYEICITRSRGTVLIVPTLLESEEVRKYVLSGVHVCVCVCVCVCMHRVCSMKRNPIIIEVCAA